MVERMLMKAETINWLASLRAKANEPGTIFIVIRGRIRSFPIYPEEVWTRSDDELLGHIRKRFSSFHSYVEPYITGGA